MLLLLVGLVMAEGKSVVPGELFTDDRIVCSGLRLNPQATHDERAAFEALCNTTARAFGTITAQYLWDAYFVCTSAANNCTSLQEYSQRYPKEFEELEAKATDLQSRYGGMYVGRIDHLESVVCQREAGSHMLGGACKACYLIDLDKFSFQRRMNRKQKATDSAPSKYTKRSVLSSSDKDQLLETQREDRSKLQRTVHRIQSALDRTKEKLGAAVMRLTGLFSLTGPSGPFSPLEHGRALSVVRCARSNSGSWQEAARSLATPDTHCAHPSFSTVRSAFLRDSPARRPRRRDGHRSRSRSRRSSGRSRFSTRSTCANRQRQRQFVAPHR